ncbi:HAUS augmin-like complex subunit 7 [Petaurus breviceps papuanus]|uniref:HAUS augmin-like complex subunit 7 n=1 Tax=Petaurus breviceps papuanus TaxID=3040969 RepID=UPI0036DA85EF
MAEHWTGLGDSNSDQKEAQTRNRSCKEDWEIDDDEDETEEDTQLSLEALRVLERLKDIDCPFLEGLYITGPRTIKQFLYMPSICLLLILEWLFVRSYPSFGDSFATVLEAGAKEKITELTRLGHELMLCGPDDQDLIKSSTGVKEQLYFFNQLLGLVTSLGPEYATSFYSVEENFHKLAKNNEMLLRKVFTSHVYKEILDPKLNPLPLDIQDCLGKKENLHRMPTGVKKMKVEELSEKLTKLAEMLQAHKDEVLSFQGSANKVVLPNPTRHPNQCSPHCGKTYSQVSGALGLTLSDFHHLVIAFIHIFEDELHEYCKRPAPNINPSGPLFQNVCDTVTLYNQELKAINAVMDACMMVEVIAEQFQ